MNSCFNDFRCSFDIDVDISEARSEFFLFDSYNVVYGWIFVFSNFFIYKLYFSAAIMVKAAFLVKKRWCIAFFWLLLKLNKLAATTISSDMMKAPQKEVTMIIILPMGEKGTRSPKPTVQMVIIMSQTDWKYWSKSIRPSYR